VSGTVELRVRIRDLTGGAEDGIVEEIKGFPSLDEANEFARRYVRDSIERCRAPGLSPREVVEAWFMFGEDAEVLEAAADMAVGVASVIDSENGGWSSEGEVAFFAEEPAMAEERDWRAIDPRRHAPDGDEGG
jgi:hypothetical protein